MDNFNSQTTNKLEQNLILVQQNLYNLIVGQSNITISKQKSKLKNNVSCPISQNDSLQNESL